MKTKTRHNLEPLLSYIATEDGWNLAAYRYKSNARRYPVLLVHGFGTNRFDVDFPNERYSLAKYLHRRGFDVWIVEFRGTGKSHKPGALAKHTSKVFTDWTFDDFIFKDLPAVTRHIQTITRRRKFHWVGHSLGGTVVYGAIEALGNGVCASGVTLGAAMSASSKGGFIRFLLKIDPLVKRLPVLPLKSLAALGSRLVRYLGPLEDNFLYSMDNVDPKVLQEILKIATENLSPRLFLQLHGWYKNNHFRSLDGHFSYRDRLKTIRAPFLVCAGSVDRLTGYPDVHLAYREISSKRKRFHVFSRETGCKTEYGHMDLVLGKNSRREVYPVVADWIERHD